MLPLARHGGFFTRLHETIHQSGTLLQLSSLFSATAADSSSPETADNVVRLGPPPIRVALTDSAGRGVFATQRIASGDLIHTASPVVSYPSLAMVHSVCYFCLRRLSNAGTEFRAAQTVSYCSDKCKEQSKVLLLCFTPPS